VKKKQLALSVMSTALVASMAASAFAAAPKAGIYIGGNVDKYYSFEAMGLNMDTFLDEMIDTVPDVLYVSKDGEAKGGNLAQLLFVSNPKEHFVDVTDEMFADIDGADGFYRVNEDGTVGTVKEKPDGTEVPGELKVESVSAINSLTVDVKFGTAVDKSTAENYAANYSITQVNGVTKTITAANLQEDGKTVRLTLAPASALTKTATNYTVSVKDVLDTKGDEIAEFSKVLSFVDNVRPEVKSTSFTDTNTFKVEFSEPVDLAQLSNAVKVYDGLSVVSGVNVSASGNTAFTVDVSGLDSKKEYKLVVNSLILDFAGNAITPNPYETVIKPVADTVDPVVESITPVNLSHFKVKFNEKIKAQSPGNYFNVAINDANITPASVTPVADTNDTEFVVKLGTEVTKGLNKVTVKNFQDVAGNPNPATDSTFTKYIDFQETAPVFTNTTGALKTVAGTNYVVFKFANPIAVNSITGSVNATRVADGVTYDTSIPNTAFAIKQGGVSGLDENELAVAITGLAEGSYSLTLPAGSVEDTFGGNNVATVLDFSVGTASTQTQVDATATEPTGSNAINGDNNAESIDQVIVVFSAEVGDSAKDVTNYTVEGQRVFKSAEFYGNKNTVRLTLNEGAIKYDGNYNLGVSGVKDKNGKDVKAYTKLVKFAENVKPYIAAAEVTDLDKVKVIFSESISATSGSLDKDDLNVYVNGTKVTITTAAFTGDIAEVTLSDKLGSTTAKVEAETSTTFKGQDTNGNLGVKGSKVVATWKITDNSDAIAAAKAELNTSIGDAQTKKGAAQVAAPNASVGKYAQADIDALDNAITAAQSVYNNASATAAQLTSAKTTLDSAVTTFEGKVIVAEVTTVDASGPAAPVAKPASGDPAVTATVTAVVKDQDGNTMNNEAVTFSIPTTTGVTIDENTGELSVTDAATAGTVTVTVTSVTDNTKTATVDVTIS